MFQKTKVCSGLLLAFGGSIALSSAPAFAQQQLQRVEITGSSIKRIDSETALPVTIIKRDDIERTGATTVADLLEKVSANNGGGYQVSAALGDAARPGFSGASLRALGSNNTLVLLNGRRLSIYAFDGGAVSLNDIPLAAIDRIEILRDGASSTYGTDAIAGVINLITRKDFKGGVVSAKILSPQHKGGGEIGLAATLGIGDLAADKYNVMVNLSHQDIDSIKAKDREFAKTAFRTDLGINRLSSNAFPANVVVPTGLASPAANFYNGGSGCTPPVSFGTSAADKRCRFDYASVIDISPESKRNSLFLRGSVQLPGENVLAAEYALARNKYTFRISPTPASEATTLLGDPLLLPTTSKYYPTAWVAANFPTLVGKDLNIYYRGVDTGPRTNQVDAEQQRFVLSMDGRVGTFDYGVGLMSAKSKATESYVTGYLSESRLLPAMFTGVINPFGPNDAAGQAALDAAKVTGNTRVSSSSLTIVDAKVSTEVMQLPAGALSIAVGGEARKEKYNDGPLPVLNTGDIIGGGGTQLPVIGKREIKAVFAEAAVPITTSLEAQLSARYDKYSDFGNTSNPKAALRWKLNNNFLVRGSVGTGFRAPTLENLYLPQTQTNTGGVFDDPFYDANVGCANIAAGQYCGAQLTVKQAGRSTLQPEKSRQFTLGSVFEPTKDVSVTVDYFHIKQRNLIGFVTADTKLDDFIAKFDPVTQTSTSKYSPEVFTKINPNAGGPGVSSKVIDYVFASYENLGEQLTSGLDISAKFRLPATAYGNFRVNWEGSYLISQKIKDLGQSSFGESFVGEYQRNGAAIRLKHRTEVLWERGGFEGSLAFNWQSGYVDAVAVKTINGVVTNFNVRPYETWDVGISYKGIKNLTLNAQILNVLDMEPGRSNQNDYFQVGYDPANTNPRGRTFGVSAEYKF